MTKTQLKYLKNDIYKNQIEEKLKSQKILILVGVPLTLDNKIYSKRISKWLLSPINKLLVVKGVKYLYFQKLDENIIPKLNILRIINDNILMDKNRALFVEKNNLKIVIQTLNTLLLPLPLLLSTWKKI